MADINHIIIVGRLVKDIELSYTKQNTAYTNFSVAVNEYQGKNKDSYTHFFDIVAWDKIALNCQKYLKKGDRITIQGKLRQERFKISIFE